jgi:hypothetical protein
MLWLLAARVKRIKGDCERLCATTKKVGREALTLLLAQEIEFNRECAMSRSFSA